MNRLDIGLLGEPRFSFDGTPWRFAAPPKCLPLLALLLLRGEPLSRAALASQLWPEETESQARANLRRHLHQIAKALPAVDGVEWIVTSSSTLAWNPQAPASVDVLEFTRLAAQPERAEEAVAAYGGDLLESNFDDAILAERERLRELHVDLLDSLAVRARAERDFASARRYADAILACDEWREDAVRLSMEVRYLSGDRSGALATFERFSERLHQELRTEPMRETLALRDAIVAGALNETAEIEPKRGTSATPLIGRDDALHALLDAWRGAARSRGTTVFVAGEAGIGKSRLVTELMSHVELQGGRAVLGRTSMPESTAYQPIVEALRRLVPFLPHADEDRAWLSALLPLLPEIGHLRDTGGDIVYAGDKSELRLKEAVLRMLAGCARLRPLAVVLEDLHLASDATVNILSSIAERLSGLPILLVVTYRAEEAAAHAPIRVVRRTLQRASRAQQLSLDRLKAEDIAELVSFAGGDSEFAERVFRASQGNPLFAWQLVRARTEDGIVESSHEHVLDALLARADALPADVRQIADVAATVGDTFTVEELAEVGGWGEPRVLAALDTLLERQFVSERTGTSFEYTFSHALFAAALYDAIPDPVRKQRHRRAAEILTQTRGEHGYALGLIAEHWLRSGDVPKARASLIRAAERLLSAHARPDARAYAQRALDLEPEPAERFAALRLVVRSINKTGATREHAALLESLERLAETLGTSERLEALGARVEYYNESGQRDLALDAAAKLRELAHEVDDARWIDQSALHAANFALYIGEPVRSEEILRTLDASRLSEAQRSDYFRQLSQTLFRQTRFDEGNAVLRQFREHLDRHPSMHGEYAYASSEMTAAWLIDDPVHLKACAERVAHLAQIRGDILDEARARSHVAYVKHQLHETSAARGEYERTIELYERAGHRQNVLITKLNAAMIEFETGHVDLAESQWREIERDLEREDFPSLTFQIGITINLAEVAFYRHLPHEALAQANRALELAVDSKETWILVNARAILGAALCATGETARGFDELRAAIEGSRQQQRAFIDYCTLYVHALVEARDVPGSSAAAAELLTAFEDDPLDQQYPGRVAWTLARAAALRGDAAEQRRLIEWGRELIETRMDAFDDERDRAAYARMAPNDLLLTQSACVSA